MSIVFQNIDPPPPSLPGDCVLPPPPPPPPQQRRGVHTRRAERGVGGGSILWKTRDIGLPSYSNNLSTLRIKYCNYQQPERSKLLQSLYPTVQPYLLALHSYLLTVQPPLPATQTLLSL
jgi:hypothetical protein